MQNLIFRFSNHAKRRHFVAEPAFRKIEDSSDRKDGALPGENVVGKLRCLNVGCADCTIITTDDETFLVDCHGIEDHAEHLPVNKKIRGVFITHQHYDHFDGLEFLKDNNYSIDHLVYSPYVRRNGDNSVEYDEWRDFEGYKTYFKNKGTKLHAPYRQDNFKDAWWSPNDGCKFYILGPVSHIANADTRELHDACLVIHAKIGARRCLFAGDASDKNLRYISDNTTNICNDILHASHHGSINGAELEFIKKCCAEYCVVSTQSGVHSNIPDPTAMQRYRTHTAKKVYRTDDDSVTWTF